MILFQLFPLRGCSDPIPMCRSYQTVPEPRHSDSELWDVNGRKLTRDQILAVAPEDRTAAHWLCLLDWSLVRQRPFVIVDPFDPSGLLYLNQADYIVQTRVLARQGITFVVVHHLGTKRPTPIKNPPLGSSKKSRGGVGGPYSSDFRRLPYRYFSSLRIWIRRNITWGPEGTVLFNEGNLRGVLVLWFREISHLLALKNPLNRLVQLEKTITHLQIILKTRGKTQVIARLKVGLFAVYSYIGGNPLESTAPFGIFIKLSSGGLPMFLSKEARQAIMTRSPDSVRLWASLLYCYKALSGPHPKPPLKTIETPPFDGDYGDFASFCQGTDSFWDRFQSQLENAQLPDPKWISPFGTVLTKGGANNSVSVVGMLDDAIAWLSANRCYPLEIFHKVQDALMVSLMDSVLVEAYSDEYCKCPENSSDIIGNDAYLDLHKKWEEASKEYSSKKSPWISDPEVADMARMFFGESVVPTLQKPPLGFSLRASSLKSIAPRRYPHGTVSILGRLHAINEAAGKVRVVAIVDYWTQLACKPFHDYIFKLLKLIRHNDATFDQQAAVNWFRGKGFQDVFSFDLTAATDTIPTRIYLEVLEPVFGRPLVELWMSLLTDRSFLLPRELLKEDPEGGIIPKFIRYTRGQPMGALSSWASLAIGHHALVQFAAFRCGLDGWFQDYLVLGDDVIIANVDVATEYKRVCSEFQIPIGLHKSLISSRGVGNFASQFFAGSDDLSPISFKEVLSCSNWASRIELAKRLLTRAGTEITKHNLLRKSVTAPQWDLLISELTGTKEPYFLRMVNLFLQYPTARNCAEGNYIESVMAWVGDFSPDLARTLGTTKHKVCDPVTVEETRCLFSDLLVSTIRDNLLTDTEAIESNLWSLYSDMRTRRTVYSLETPWSTHPVYKDYLLDILVSKLRGLTSEMSDILDKIKDDQILTLDVISLVEVVESLQIFKTLPTELPKPFVFDIIKPICETEEALKRIKLEATMARKGIFMEPARKVDSLRGPLISILEVVARMFGEILPLGALSAKFGQSELRVQLADLVRSRLDWKARADASPAFDVRETYKLTDFQVGANIQGQRQPGFVDGRRNLLPGSGNPDQGT